MRKGFTLIELMIVIAIIAIIAAIAIPGLLQAQRSSNERNASASLKTLTSAQADFRSNDRDGDRLNNFWTGNIIGLYSLTPSTDGIAVGTEAPANMIKLIELSVAGAEGAIPPAAGAGLVAPATGVTGARSPKAAYLFTSFTTDENGTAYSDAVVAGQPYSGSHNFAKFGAIAVPVALNAGRSCFIVNEDNTVFRGALPANYTGTFSGNWAAAGLGAVANFQVVGANTWTPTVLYPPSNWPALATAPVTGFGFAKLD